MGPLVLASRSPYRRELLARLGLEFECHSPGVDERALESPGLEPRALAARLARAKAEAVAAEHPQAVVIGSDQVCAFEGRCYGKPGSLEAAAERLLAMAGREHQLVTSVCVLGPLECVEFTEVARMTLRPLTREQALRYVERDRTEEVAGGYKLESLGIALFEAIECRDYTAIIGLPLMRLAQVLQRLGFSIL